MKRILLLLVAITIIAGAYLYWKTPDTEITPTTATTTEEQAVRTYLNEIFGVSFQYDPTQVGVLPQSTSTIAVYALGTDPAQGQSIERFNKLESESLEQSIRRQILAGYSTTTCTVGTATSSNGYIKAEITYPVPAESPLGHEEICNASYDKTNGIRYFLYDPAQRDRFYFVDIGQYALLASPGRAWPDTIEIL